MLTSSHTHSGPVLGTSLTDCYPLDQEQRNRIEQYSQWLEGTVVSTVAKALRQWSSARLYAGEGTTDFAVNRRNNPANEVPRLREAGELKGPWDHRVPVLAVRSEDGEWLSVVFGYACHNTTLAGYEWCGDYAGYAQLALEEKYPQTQAMFHSGCGADQNPLPRRSVDLCKNYGEMLATAVDEVLETEMRTLDSSLGTSFARIALDYGQQPTRSDLESLASTNDYRGRWAKRLLAQWDAGHAFDTAYRNYPIQVWRLGSAQWWIVMGGEVVVDYPLRFKECYGPDCWVTGYANDVMAYIPSKRIWEEGGYEAGAFSVYGLPAERWSPDIEERIVGCVERLVEKLQVAEPVAAQ
jgi:hypothetical protein